MKPQRWTVLVPVKGGATSKSRLPKTVGGVKRADLARALARDTIASIRATEGVSRVVVIAGDADVVETVGVLGEGIEVVDQPAGLSLNGAIAHGLRGILGPVAVVLGDVPAAQPHDIGAALVAAAAVGRAVVADADGTGTTMLAAVGGVLEPRFGPGSFARHVAAGYVPLAVARSMRADVDTEADLARVVALGVGHYTASALGLIANRGGSGD